MRILVVNPPRSSIGNRIPREPLPPLCGVSQDAEEEAVAAQRLPSAIAPRGGYAS